MATNMATNREWDSLMGKQATDTLTDFLLARIAEDEAVARDCYAIPPWRAEGYWLMNHAVIAETDEVETTAHIARHDPARVLSECEAKRQRVAILAEMYASEDNMVSSYAYSLLCREALPHADHDQFQEEWRL